MSSSATSDDPEAFDAFDVLADNEQVPAQFLQNHAQANESNGYQIQSQAPSAPNDMSDATIPSQQQLEVRGKLSAPVVSGQRLPYEKDSLYLDLRGKFLSLHIIDHPLATEVINGSRKLLKAFAELCEIENAIPAYASGHNQLLSSAEIVTAMACKQWPDLWSNEGKRLIRMLLENDYLSSIEIEQAAEAEAQLGKFEPLNGVMRRAVDYKVFRFANRTFAVLFTQMREPVDFEADFVSKDYHNFHTFGCGQQIFLDLARLPDRSWAAKAGTAIALKFLEMRDVDRYKEMLDEGSDMPFLCYGNFHFYFAFEEDPELLNIAFRAFEAIARSRCFEMFVLRLSGRLFKYRAKLNKELAGLGDENKNFYWANSNACSLLEAATNSISNGLASAIHEVDSGIGGEMDLDRLVRLLKSAPEKLAQAQEAAWTMYQDWRASVPQVAFHHHRCMTEHGPAQINDLWHFHNQHAKNEDKEEQSYFRRIKTLERINAPRGKWRDNAKDVVLPAGSRNQDAASVLINVRGLLEWEAAEVVVGNVLQLAILTKDSSDDTRSSKRPRIEGK